MSEAAGKRAGPVSVERIDERNCDAAIALEVAEEHLHYVLPVAEMLKRDGRDEALENYAVRAAGVVVGFFRLDSDRRRVSEYAGNGSYCGLRGYLIGRRH